MIDGYPNELIQCFINLLNNAKDAFNENDINANERYIFINQSINQSTNTIVIAFKDSAGGIPDTIIKKIFEPYFTTKHKSIGTGLGLHMSYKLIVNQMGGSFSVRNKHYEYKGKMLEGAEFIIELTQAN